MDSAALIIRPRRFKISSANATMRKLGEAVGEAARKVCAISISLASGLAAQAMENAVAVDRDTPAQQ